METDYNYKYSTKIIKFINNNLKGLNYLINPIVSGLNNNKLFNNILELIISTYEKHYNYHPDIHKIFQIHNVNQYPLLYIFFCKLYELNVLNNIIDDPIIISDFAQFIKWYRENQTFINLQLIYDDLKKIDQNDNTELLQLYYLIYQIKGHRCNLHELLYNNPFVSLDVQHHAESVDMIKYIYNTSEFNLTIYEPDIKCKLYYDINKIIHIIKFMNELGKLNNSTNVPNICIFCGLQRKQLLYLTNKLCPDNINSGSSVRGKYVRIWRAEEIYKVLIHELIHFHKLDFHYNSKNYDLLLKYYIDTYNVKGIDCPNESYTETLAVIIHSLFISFYHKYTIENVLKYEIIFTLFQISKILKFFDINKIEDLKYKPINQTTSVFSYFIVKGSLLTSLRLFLEYINYDIKNLSIENKVESFQNLIKLSMNKEYFKLINEMVNITEGIKVDKNSFIMKTLRMTCCAL